MYLSSFASADSTFFDDSNDAFIMGQASVVDNAAPISQQTGGGSNDGSSCPAGYNFTGGKCIYVSSSNGLSASGKVNESLIIIPPLPESEQGDGTNKTEEVEEPQLIGSEPSAFPAKIDTKKLAYITLALGIMLLVVCVLFFWKRKKRHLR